VIHTSVFCPFERTAAVLINKAKEAGVSTIKLTFDNFRSDCLMSTEKIDQNLGFTDAQKVLFLTQPEITGSITFVERGVTRRFRVKNVMETSQPLKRSFSIDGKSGLYNGEDALGGPIAFEEAARTTAGTGTIISVPAEGARPMVTRPLMQYILVSAAEDEYVIFGPKVFSTKQVYAYVNIAGHDYDLVRDVEVMFKEDDVIGKKTEEINTTVPADFYLKYDFEGRSYCVPVIFGQINYAINGKRLSGITMLAILESLVYQELFNNRILETYSDKPLFPIRVRKDMWELTEDFIDNVFDPYVTANEE